MRESVRAILLLMALMAFSTRAEVSANPFDSDAAPAGNAIDQVVFARLERLQIQPARICSDAVFVRRVYLDVLGTLPAASEAREFLLSRDSNKRSALIDRLLEREEFVDYQALKWSDLLRVKAEFPINLWPNAAQAYYRWIHTSLKENKPGDQFARELLTSSGSNFRVGQVNFYRALQNKTPEGIAQAVALTFMGTRTDRWPTNRLADMAAFFMQVGYKYTAEWKEEIVYWDPGKAAEQRSNSIPASARFSEAPKGPLTPSLSPSEGERVPAGRVRGPFKGSTREVTGGIRSPIEGDGELWATFPDGTRVRLADDRDPREVFADWLIDPKNPWFTRSIANRVWSWLLGRGIIHEPDDIRPDNPPANPELLALLERELIASHYDLKQLYRLILNSKTYQLASVALDHRPEAEANFAHYAARRLEAEVLIDALNEITGSTEKYSSAIPEPFTFLPEHQRAVALPDGSITSSFLDLFGRSPRDTGLEAERNNRSTAAQSLHLLNSSHIQRKIEQSRMIQYQLQGNKPMREITTAMYLGILSRFPTEAELKKVEDYARSAANRREAVVDLAWALINSAEFLYRH